MSRVDQALARAARNNDRRDGRPVPADVPAADAGGWADEAPLHRTEPPSPQPIDAIDEEPAAPALFAAAEPAAPAPQTAVQPVADDYQSEPEPVVYQEEPPAAVPVPSTPIPSGNGHDEVDLGHLALAEKLVVGAGVDASSIEQFRRLAAQLYLSQAQRRTRVVMIASALPGEGKTLTATNLALTLSESYKRHVLLVDGDLRRPDLHQLFQVPNLSGLNDGIRSEIERKVPLIHLSDRLSLLTAGRPDTDPMSVLASERIRRVLDEAREKFEWVIVDTPPLGLLTDAHLLSAMIDAAVLVIQAGRTPLAAIKRAVEALGRERIAGIVLNRVKPAQMQAEYAYYYSASQEQV